MKRSQAILRQWSKNVAKSPLVNQTTGSFDRSIALQLLNGRNSDNYSDTFPHGFERFYQSLAMHDENEIVETLLKYLHFTGISLNKDSLQVYLTSPQADRKTLFKKVLLIFKSWAYQPVAADKPFNNMYGDIDFLLRIETGQSQLSIFDEPLPQLYGKDFAIPNSYEKDPTVKNLFDQIEHSKNSFLITGKAGTGKSTFIRFFNQKTKKVSLRMAFTGIAAINVGGVTIHSFFQFPLRPLLPGDEDIPIFGENSYKRETITGVDTIIIDEISMLRADVLEAIDYSLRKNGGEETKPFGGKQILFVGDPFQLPPVTNGGGEVEQYLFQEFFKSSYFFDSDAYSMLQPQTLILTKSHRQKEDHHFVQLLDEVRLCESTERTFQELNKRVVKDYIPKQEEFSITLTTSNAIANTENQRRLAQLTTPKFTYTAVATGDFNSDHMPPGQFLELRKGAQVIFIKNDSSGFQRWVNGTIGIVDFVGEDQLEVRVASGEVYKVERETWDNRGYKFDKRNSRIVSEVKGRVLQYPIKLAWAITIHKSQGLTFEKVIIDLGKGAFVNGQLYTALSRCKKLEGIILRRPVSQKDVIRDKKLLDFYKSLNVNS